MKFRLLFFVIVLALLSVFVWLNWDAFAAQETLSLGIVSFEAPLGLLVLGLAIALVVPLLAYTDYLQRASLAEAVRNSRKLEAQHNLAVRAEASRYASLRAFLEAELGRSAEFQAEVLRRLDQLEASARANDARREFEADRHRSLAKREP